MNITGFQLNNLTDWTGLAAHMSAHPAAGPLPKLLEHLQAAGACFAVCEDSYLDRDFTAEFSEFYSKLFKRYSKICRRYSFFSHDLSAVFANTDAEVVATELETQQSRFLGFIVVRPVGHAPIGRSVLLPPPSPAGRRSNLLVKAPYSVHLLGASFQVTGTPLIQQDSRVGACAQAAIWMAGRHFHTKHRGPWYSVAQITQEASKPADRALSMTLPAGSGFLTLDNMVRALRAMGREPFSYVATVTPSATPTTPPTIAWQAPLRPGDVIHRYVDSGIPVILGILAGPNEQVGHAALAVGHTIKNLNPQVQFPPRPTRAEFCEHFLVNDDQLGAYLRMPAQPAAPDGETPYSVADRVQYILIPLPAKVYVPGEIAERLAWDTIEQYPRILSQLVGQPDFKIGDSAPLATAFAIDLAGNNLVARTYLTYGWKYRNRMVRNVCSNEIKREIVNQDLPRFVWVTEFGTRQSLNHLDPKQRRIFAHTVVDATSSQVQHSLLVLHAPGFIIRWFHNASDPGGDYAQSTRAVSDDLPYYPKVRGKMVL